MKHVFGSCVCRWLTCLLMIVVLVYLNACVFITYLVSCIRSRVYMLLNSNFSYISTCVVIYHQKGGDYNHLGPFAPLVRVCFGDK
jgi:hypothetical protein